MTLIDRKKRVYLRFVRKNAQRATHGMKGVRGTIILRDADGVNLLKARVVRGKIIDHSLKFNR